MFDATPGRPEVPGLPEISEFAPGFPPIPPLTPISLADGRCLPAGSPPGSRGVGQIFPPIPHMEPMEQRWLRLTRTVLDGVGT